MKAGTFSSGTPPRFTDAEKLVTWDKVGVSITGNGGYAGPDTFSNFEITVSNNVETAYALGQTDLFPFDLVPGLRTITGSVSAYNVPTANGADNWDAYDAGTVGTITFDIGGLSVSALVRFHRVEPASSVGPIISTVGFTGVTSQNWD